MANQINRQQTFSTNGTVTAAGLHNLIDTAIVNSAIIKNQQEITTIGTADLLLIAPDSVDASLAPRKVTVQNLIDDGLTSGTYTSLSLTGALTYGTATGNRTVSTTATITTGTIPNLTAGTTTSTAATITNGTITNGTIATALIPTLTAGTTTGTAGIFTSGTVATLNSTTGTITNLSTTLAGDFTISQGTGTLGTTGATLGTYGGATSVPVLAIDAKGRVTSTGTSAITTGYTGFRNCIVNGDMRVDQRNSGASQTFTAGAALAYCVDRFYGYCTGANVTGQRVAGTASNEFVYRFTGAASVTAIGFGTRLEATNTIDLAGSTATLSVQLANSLLTTVTWTAFYANTADAFGTLASPTRTQIATGTFTVNSTLTTYSTQISIPSSATTGIEIVFTVGAQTSGTWTIDNVQLEAGSSATAFERRPYGTELALCQRYYYSAPASSHGFPCPSSGGFAQIVTYYWKVSMRASPTVTHTLNSSFNLASNSAQNTNNDLHSRQYIGSSFTNTTWNFNDGGLIASAEL
ncbi:MAG: hypothetical protein EBT07_13110 [Actinobacteria bacterium]|nr:hypothetical protein [Actinomycetota bacterium]